MRYYSKHLAVAKITDPTAVQAKCASMGIGDMDKGAIWINIPEIGFVGNMMIYCRYGLSIPYIRVQVDDKLWVEPTVGDTERWIYTGFADCGNSDAEPGATSQLIIPLGTGQFTIKIGTDMEISGDTATTSLKISSGTTGSKVTINDALEITK
jgi:hypothetical protein